MIEFLSVIIHSQDMAVHPFLSILKRYDEPSFYESKYNRNMAEIQLKSREMQSKYGCQVSPFYFSIQKS